MTGTCHKSSKNVRKRNPYKPMQWQETSIIREAVITFSIQMCWWSWYWPYLCNIDPTCLPTPWLQSSLPLTVTPFLHHQLGLTKLHDGLAGLVLQQPAIEEFSMESTREEDEEVKEVEEVFSMQQMILIQMWERMIDMAMAEPKADGDVLVRIKKVSDGKPHMEWLVMRGEDDKSWNTRKTNQQYDSSFSCGKCNLSSWVSKLDASV